MKKLSIFTVALGFTALLSSFIGQNEQTPASLITGKWKMADLFIVDMPKLTETQQAEFDKEMKTAKDSSSLEIKANGTYHNVSWAGKTYQTDGKWKLSTNGKLLFLSDQNNTRTDTVKIVSMAAKKMIWDMSGNKVTYVK